MFANPYEQNKFVLIGRKTFFASRTDFITNKYFLRKELIFVQIFTKPLWILQILFAIIFQITLTSIENAQTS